jgi:hypothetical protein
MRWREANGEWTTQQAIWLAQPRDSVSRRLQSYFRFWDLLYCHRFLLDVGNLIPYGRGKVVLVGDSGSVEKLICKALSRGLHSERRDITEALREFCNICAPIVVAAGEAVFETILVKPEKMYPIAQSFHLMHVGNYRRRFCRSTQYQPERGWIQLEQNLLVVFQLDKARRKAVRKSLETLATASRYDPILHKVPQKPPQGYDFKLHQLQEAVSVSRATRTLGWNESMFMDYYREPYQVSRAFEWYQFRIELREMVVEGLNRALRIAGSAIGFDAQLELRGFPAKADLAEARMRLKEGRCNSLVELVEPFVKMC